MQGYVSLKNKALGWSQTSLKQLQGGLLPKMKL